MKTKTKNDPDDLARLCSQCEDALTCPSAYVRCPWLENDDDDKRHG